MILSPGQVRAVHAAARQAGLADEQRRVLMRNLAGVRSCKDRWTRVGFQCVMAALEDLAGGRLRGNTSGYWREQADGATDADALRWRIGEEACALGWSLADVDAFLASRHMSCGRHRRLADAPVYWCSRVLDAVRAIKARGEAVR